MAEFDDAADNGYSKYDAVGERKKVLLCPYTKVEKMRHSMPIKRALILLLAGVIYQQTR